MNGEALRLLLTKIPDSMSLVNTRRLQRFGMTCFLATFFSLATGAFSFADEDDDALRELAARENVGMPKTINENYRLDGFGTAPNHTLLVKYTLTNLDLSQLPKDAFKKAQREELVEVIGRSTNLKPLLKAGAKIKFQYFNEAGELWVEILFTPLDVQ